MAGEQQRRAMRAEARAVPSGELLQAPASGLPCVAWRLRVVERVAGALELVHELGSTEPFELELQREAGQVRVSIDGESAILDAATVRHEDGSPGAAQVARQFGFGRPVVVEETVLRPGELVEVEGDLEAPAPAAGPYRGTELPIRLLGPRLHARGARPALGSTLLPWVLVTAAAVLAALGTAVYVLARTVHHPRSPAPVQQRIERMAPQTAPTPRFP